MKRIAPTKPTPKGILVGGFFAVWWMVTKWTNRFTSTVSNVVSAGYSMTWVTKMSRSETEPKCDRTAKPTFKVYIVDSVLATLSHTFTHSNSRTLRTYKLFCFELLFLKLILLAVLHSTEVRRFTLKAHIIRTFIQGKILKFIVIGIP